LRNCKCKSKDKHSVKGCRWEKTAAVLAGVLLRGLFSPIKIISLSGEEKEEDKQRMRDVVNYITKKEGGVFLKKGGTGNNINLNDTTEKNLSGKEKKKRPQGGRKGEVGKGT